MNQKICFESSEWMLELFCVDWKIPSTAFQLIQAIDGSFPSDTEPTLVLSISLDIASVISSRLS